MVSTWNDDDRAFFDKALLAMAPSLTPVEIGTTRAFMNHCVYAAANMTDLRKEALEQRSGLREITHENASTVGA